MKWLRAGRQAMPSRSAPSTRRLVLSLAALLVSAITGRAPAGQGARHPDAKWYREALAMKLLAESWGDRSYGAVVILDDVLVGAGPSRVVKDGNPDAHAERVALLDAQRRLGRPALSGAILYSTSRPCALCEAAAARAGVARMYFGTTLEDAGAPKSQN